MKNTLLGGLSSLLLPLGAYSAGAAAGTSYQRTYLSSSVSASAFSLPATSTALSRDLVDLTGDELDIQKAYPVRELVVVDAGVADKAMLHSALKPGVAIVEIDSARAGLPQLISALAEYKNLAAIHIVSHAEAGAILLGNSRITPDNIQQEVHAFAALHGAVREGGDLLFYGCDLAANKAGEELLDIISNKTGLDVAASNDLTGNSALHGDWDLEVKRGNVEAELAFSEKALADFSDVLAPAANATYTFASPEGFADAGTTLTSTHFVVSAGPGALTVNRLPFDTSIAYIPVSTLGDNTGSYIYVKADGTDTTAFELTALASGEYAGYQFTNVHIKGYLQSGAPVTSSVFNGAGTSGESFNFSPAELANFSGKKLKGFKLFFDCQSGCGANSLAGFEFKSFTIQNAIDTPPAPVVTDAKISISGASGTGGAYKIGDTVTATWNNAAVGGDNNAIVSGVTVDFSQFGGSATATANPSGSNYIATYTITAGAIDATANVSVTATNAGGDTTTADTTNAVVDNIAPTVTDPRISISGATGTSGAYKIGDAVTATWNDTAGGDNNIDTISSVTVNFSEFGGGAAVAATNSSDSWTATYTIVSGVIDTTNRNVSVTATDNAGNAMTVADTTNATADNNPPSVSSIAVKGTPAATDTSMEFTVTFDESVGNISTDDFALATTSGAPAGNIASVSAASGSSVDVTINNISGNGAFKLNLNGSTNIADDAGNGVAAFTAGSSHTVAIPTAPTAPTIGTATAGDGQASVTFSAPGNNGGSAITTYTATANPGGAFGTCAGPAACTATVTGLSNGTAYTFTVTATNGIGTSTASGASNSVTPKGVQTITFGNPGAQNFGTTPTLSATATSSLTPTFSSSTTGVCTITSGGALTFVTAGSCTIDADQAGNTAWNAATTVTQTFTVNAVVPGAPTIGAATAGDEEATVTFAMPASNGGATITSYTVTSNLGGFTGTGAGSPITVAGLDNGVAYTFTVTATNSAGEGAPSAASNSVTPASPQTITFGNPGTQNFGTTPTLTATSDAGGGYPVSFTSSTTGVCTITAGGALTFVTIGSCTINADQAGDSSFLAAPQVSQTFTVAAVVPGAPTATAAIAGDTQASVAFTAPVFTGGSAITSYTVTVNPADVAPIAGAASPIVVTGLTNGQAYTFTVTADNVVGTGPASPASNSITPAATQTITFAAPGAQSFGTTPTFTATADSGLAPTFTSSTTGVCTITSGGALTFVTIGNCTINADQAGNGSYLAAPQVTRTFAVNAVAPGAPTAAVATAGNASASVAFTAPVFAGGTGITGYTVTSNPGGITGTGAGSPIAVTGLSNGVAYTFTVTATNPAGTSSPSAASNSVTPNGAPTIGGTPTLSVAQDVAYSFIPTANDTLGDTLTFSITNKPSWAAFNTATGALTGTPTNANIGTTTGIVISVTDGALSASLAAFNLTVTNTNEAPTITGTPTVSVAQDVAYSFIPTGNDVDVGDVLTFSITNKPTWAAFNAATGTLTGTPTNADVGTTTGIVISVSDGTLSASLAAFNLAVTNVNEAPTITGTPAVSAAQDVAYSFMPTGNDVDVGDVLTYSIVNKPTWAAFDTVTGALTGTPTHDHVGTTTGIVISVSDGTLSADLPAFNLEVVETIDPLQPIVTAPADLVIDATALFTPVSLRQLLGLNASATQAQVDQLLAGMASDGVSGNTCCVTSPEGLNIRNVLLLRPGRHQVTWTATNAADVTGTAVQTIDVRPLVSLSKSQIAIRGSAVEFRVLLNGKAPEYPVSVPYVIDTATTAGTNEHNLVNGVANFTEEGQVEVVVPVQLANLSGLSDSELVVRLDGDINTGVTNTHTIRIREGNIPPIALVQLSQGGVNTTQITPTGGPVTVTASVFDLNPGDTQAYDWSASDSVLGDTDGNPVDNTLVFDPSGLTGRHQVQLTVTDSGGASANAQLYFRVVASLPVLLPDADTDGDGVDDLDEGLGDSNNNGIPDYLDNMPSSNILPQAGNTTNSYLIECDPGVRCGLGKFALTGNSGGVQILNEELGTTGELIVDPAFEPVGGIFDFVINDLPTPGQSVRIVIPQQAAIPANATYRKYQNGVWVSFIENTNNAIFSAPGNPGYCPPPGTPDWTPGLTEGNLCVQLTIEDGGPNDDDGLVNSALADPGAVSVAEPVEPPPPPPPPPPPVKPPVDIKSTGGGGAMSGIWLLMLGVLLVFKRVKPKYLVLVALVISAGNVKAGDGGDFYIRADLSSVVSSQEENDFKAALDAAGHQYVLNDYDENRSGYHLALGYEWASFTFTEIGYLDLGEVEVNLTLPGTADLDSFAQDFAANYPLSAEGFTLVQGVVLTPNSSIKVAAEIGVFVWDSEIDVERQALSVDDDSGTDPVVGLKVEFPLGDHVGLGAGLRRVYFNDQEADLFSLTGSYHF